MSAELGRRLLTAALVLPALVAAVAWGPPLLTEGLIVAALLLGMRELLALLATGGARPSGLLAHALGAGCYLAVAHPGWPAGALGPAIAALALLGALGRARTDLPAAVPAVAAALFAATYLGGLGGALAALRSTAPPEAGAWRLLLLLAGVMSADTFAYFTGNALGRHRLAPAMSPSKTVEGACGSLVGGVAGVAALGLPALGLPVPHAILLGAGVGAAAVVGDLAESLVKRWAGVKDSGRLFPGHGGMLDRLDSILLGAPVVYYYFVAV